MILTLCKHIDMRSNIIGYILTTLSKCNLYILSHNMHDDNLIVYL